MRYIRNQFVRAGSFMWWIFMFMIAGAFFFGGITILQWSWAGIFLISIGVAVIYLNIGFILGMIEDIKKKDYKTLIFERIVWIVLQIGIALIALKINPV